MKIVLWAYIEILDTAQVYRFTKLYILKDPILNDTAEPGGNPQCFINPMSAKSLAQIVVQLDGKTPGVDLVNDIVGAGVASLSPMPTVYVAKGWKEYEVRKATSTKLTREYTQV